MRVHHLAIACADIMQSRDLWSKLLNMAPPDIHILENRGVKACVFNTSNLRIELVEPLGENSPIAKFVKERGGGLHHLALETWDIENEMNRGISNGLNFIGDKPLEGLGNTRVIFIHPKSIGVLVELVEPPKE